MKTLALKVKSNSSDFYVVKVEIADTIKIHCNCGAGIFGKLCKHKTAILSGNSDILLDIAEKPMLEEINGAINKSDFINLNYELESAKKMIENAKKQEAKIKSKLENALKNGIKINS